MSGSSKSSDRRKARSQIRLLLADEMLLLRQALKRLLQQSGFVVVADVSDGREAVDLARKFLPDVAILEIGMPGMNGIEVAREIHRSSPSTRTMILTTIHDHRHVLEALQEGVRGFVLKTQTIDELTHAIKEVRRGRIYVGAAAPPVGYTLKAKPLSSREREVLLLISDGMSTKEIASALKISTKTAGFHRSRLMEKLSIHESTGLVRYAIRHGLVVP